MCQRDGDVFFNTTTCDIKRASHPRCTTRKLPHAHIRSASARPLPAYAQMVCHPNVYDRCVCLARLREIDKLHANIWCVSSVVACAPASLRLLGAPLSGAFLHGIESRAASSLSPRHAHATTRISRLSSRRVVGLAARARAKLSRSESCACVRRTERQASLAVLGGTIPPIPDPFASLCRVVLDGLVWLSLGLDRRVCSAVCMSS